MFRNQVVKASRNLGNVVPDVNYMKNVDEVIPSIMKCEGFHMGSPNELTRVFQKSLTEAAERKQKIFTGEFGVDVNLPFDEVWFDWQGEIYDDSDPNPDAIMNMKMGSFITNHIDIPDTIAICPFYHGNHYNWLMGVNWIFVNTKRDFTEDELLRTFKQCFRDASHLDVEKVVDAYISVNGLDNIFRIPHTTNHKVLPVSMVKNAVVMERTVLSLINCSLMLINCKNITCSKTNYRKESGKKVNKVKPIHEYYVLDIKPNKPKHVYEGNNNSTPGDTRLHLCRGHFKNRKTGRYWWSSHVRGNVELGTINKDYNVKHQSK